MLTPHPATLRKLVDEYHALLAEEAERGGPRTGRRSEDLAYTLCVSTGTRDIRAALATAHRMLAAGPLAAGGALGDGLPAGGRRGAGRIRGTGRPLVAEGGEPVAS
ncbi:DUF5133 domain-containing protein [Streptomyces fragilis]|uniref:DUF5133 domain-containing protein n=1 Tax=Streptomyces fragilis TaxID=67301 RepID=A0ABV2YPQ6_9ACTN|nr:DUF5133 domain-containing protein [Streptomyces fragilis]